MYSLCAYKLGLTAIIEKHRFPAKKFPDIHQLSCRIYTAPNRFVIGVFFFFLYIFVRFFFLISVMIYDNSAATYVRFSTNGGKREICSFAAKMWFCNCLSVTRGRTDPTLIIRSIRLPCHRPRSKTDKISFTPFFSF